MKTCEYCGLEKEACECTVLRFGWVQGLVALGMASTFVGIVLLGLG